MLKTIDSCFLDLQDQVVQEACEIVDKMEKLSESKSILRELGSDLEDIDSVIQILEDSLVFD
jgi:hypothetical protein